LEVWTPHASAAYGVPPPPYSFVEDYLATEKEEQGGGEATPFRSRARYGSRMDLALCMMKHRRLVDTTGDNGYLNPTISLETAGPLPPILLYHSKHDEAVSFSASLTVRSIHDHDPYTSADVNAFGQTRFLGCTVKDGSRR